MSICRDCATNCQSVAYGGYRGDHYRALAIGLTEVTLTRMVGDIIEYFAKGFTLEVRTIGIADEIEEHLTLLQHDLLDAQLLAIHTERHHADEFFCYIGNGTETVDQTFAIGLEIIIEMVATSQIIKFTIEQHTFRVAGDILIGEVHLDIGFKGAVINPLNIEH